MVTFIGFHNADAGNFSSSASLEDVMEMRRQSFDDRVMEGPQNISQKFLLV
jgi:hypothetical protein